MVKLTNMDLKKKIKNLLQKEGLQKVHKAFGSGHVSGDFLVPPSFQILPISRRDSEFEVRSLPSDPEADEKILQTIDPMFFTSDSFDPSLHELQKLPTELDVMYIKEARQRLLKELTVVSKRVFQLILEKQSCYTDEIQRIREIEDDLVAAIFTCKESRVDLSFTKKEFTTKSLSVLANYRKRQASCTLLKSLRTIHTLQRTEQRLQELLAEDDFPSAIQLILECQQATVTYSHFNCISELSKKLQDTLENAEEQLDVALSKVCQHFDEKHYEKLQRAYQMLGKTHTCVDQLLMHFASAVHNTAFSVVHGFAELCRIDDQPMNLQKKQYQDLCSCLTSEIFIPCLVDLGKALWKILLSYHKLLSWHWTKTKCAENVSQEDADVNQEYVDQKLTNGSARIWQDIQTKIRTFLLACDFSGFKIDDFMQILSVIHSLKEVGSEFCNSESESLRDCIREASLRYFLRYHHSKLDELRIFLENEGWEICPVRSDFDIHKLQEFKFLRNISSTTSPDPFGRTKEALFVRYYDTGSPFEIVKEESEENIYAAIEKISSRGQNSEPNDNEYESGEDGLDEEEAKDTGDIPIITNTLLSILRLFGRYFHMMHLLKPIAYDVALCISQLFEYYFYTVFVFFGSENGEVTIESLPNAQLRMALSRIRDKLIKDESVNNTPNGKVGHPFPSPAICLTNESDLQGLAARVVASESTVYLALQMDLLKPLIQRHIQQSSWESISQLIDQAVIVSEELRRPVFAGVSCKAVDYLSIVESMDKVNWEVKELMSQHSKYVDILLRGLQIFAMKVDDVSAHVVIPLPVHSIIWEQIFRFCCRAFVDGFSNARKCSNGGRGLMQLDFMQYLSKLEKISPVSLKGSPDREFVESYVKAYYMPENIMEEWIQSHSEYSGKQLISLVNCAWQGNKKSKLRLQGIVEELDKTKR